MVTRVPHSEIVEMLRIACHKEGLDLYRFYHLGKADDLYNPRLRELWLIWGSNLSEEDLDEPEPIPSR